MDDVLCMSHGAMRNMKGIQRSFKLKDDNIEEPETYLGARLSKMLTANGTKCWSMSSEAYYKADVNNIETNLRDEGRRLPSNCDTLMRLVYRPELDKSPELKADGLQYYQELIGVLCLSVELGRVDILYEVATMSMHLAMTRIGHLQELFRVFWYLKADPKRKLAFDPDHPMVDERQFKRYDWHEFYRGVKEAIPVDMPTLRGNSASTHCFGVVYLAVNYVYRRSQKGILIFVNRAPIIWYSTIQNTIEVSTFGSEITATKNAIYYIEALRYKLRMFGVPVDGATNIFCVTRNCSDPTSMLKKKHH